MPREHINALMEERDRTIKAASRLAEEAEKNGGKLTVVQRSGFDKFNADIDRLSLEIIDEMEMENRTALANEARRSDPVLRAVLSAENTVPSAGNSQPSGEFRHGQWVASEFRAGELLSPIGSGKLTPSHRATQFVDLLTPSTAFLSSGVQKVYLPEGVASYDLPVVDTDHAAAWAAEGADMSTTGFDASVLSIAPKKIAAMAYLSDELVGDSSPSALDAVGRSMVRSIGAKVDAAAFANTTTNGPGGLAGVSGVWNVDAGANGALLTNLDTVADAAGKVLGAGAESPVLVMHPDLWSLLTRLKTDSGSNVPLVSATAGVAGKVERRILGYPVFLSKQISLTESLGTSGNVTTSIWVYDPSQVYAVFRQPSDLPIVQTDQGYSRFKEGLTGLRAILRAGFGFPVPEAIARVRGIKLSA